MGRVSRQDEGVTPAPRRGGGRKIAAVSAGTLSTLRRHFEEFGLTGSEAAVLLALLRLGHATVAEVATNAGVPRQTAYPTLEGLAARQLADQLPGRIATWAPVERERVVDRLYEAQEERVRDLGALSSRTRELLAVAIPHGSRTPLPFAHVIGSAAQPAMMFERLQAGARREVAVFSRPPYTDQRRFNTGELDSLSRGVVHRAIYQTADFDSADAAAFRAHVEIYVEAGEDARVVDQLPVKLAIFDRKVSLISLDNPALPVEDPTILVVEHPGFSEFAMAAFEQFWRQGRRFSRGAVQPGLSEALSGVT